MKNWALRGLCPNCNGKIYENNFKMIDTMSRWNWLRRLLEVPQLILKTTKIWTCRRCGRETQGLVFK